MKTRKKKMQRIPKVKSLVPVNPVKLLLTFLLLLQLVPAGAQQPEMPFSGGESVLYGAYYNWHFIWMNSGEVQFTTKKIQYNKQDAWNFKAVGKTYKAYDLLYTVRDTFESVVSSAAFDPLWFRRSVNHGHGHSFHEYHFNKEKGLITTNIQREDEKPFKSQQPLKSGVYDLLTTAYRFRGFNFNKMKDGEKVNFTMLVDNKVEDLYFRYQGIEEVKTRNGLKFRCHKVSVWLLEGDFFPEGEYMKVWFTADQNRLPIMVETKIQIGSVKAIFLGASHLKYPLNAKL